MNNILCTIVLYKMKLCESKSFLAIYNQAMSYKKKITFYIHDNSPIKNDVDFKDYQNLCYVHCPENKGLGYAYNKAALHAKKHHISWLLFLDQDTNLPSNFLQKYIEAISLHPDISLFSPLVRITDKEILSPMRRWKKQHKPLDPDTIYPVNNYMLINSGLCVHIDAFYLANGYKESIWLDFADTQFVRKLFHNRVNSFYLISSECIQNFSNRETDIDQLKKRFDIYMECAKNCDYLDFDDWLFRQQCILSHTLSLTFRSYSIYFIKHFFSKYFLR